MKNLKKICGSLVLCIISVLWMFCAGAFAEEYYEDASSGDNSLYSLGLGNASDCSPEFYYSTLEYNVTVPAGTRELELNPETSSSSASIIDLSGTTLDDSGNGTVYITVQAANGAEVTYVLHVTSEGAAAETEAETENLQAQQEAQAKAESERLAKESEAEAQRQAAVNEKQQQVDLLKAENDDFASRIDMLMKILYGLIAFAVILLFVIINQSLRNKDLKDEVKAMKQQGADSYEFARKEQNLRSDYYYAPVNHTPQPQMDPGMRFREASGNVQAAFGNETQRFQDQPMNGAMPPQMEMEPAAAQEEPELSKRELKKLEKEAKKAAKKAKNAPETPQGEPDYQQMPPQAGPNYQQAPQGAPNYQQMDPGYQQQGQPQPTMVQSTVEEQDVNVDMIDL